MASTAALAVTAALPNAVVTAALPNAGAMAATQDVVATAAMRTGQIAGGGAAGTATDNSQQHADVSANGGTASGGNGGATAAMNTGAATASGGTAYGGSALAAGGPATSGTATMGNFATVSQSPSQTMSGLTQPNNWQTWLYDPRR